MPPNPAPVSSQRAERASSPGHRIGATISAVFGLVYVEVNAGSLPATMALILRVLAGAAFVAVLVRLWREGPDPDPTPDDAGGGFNRRYWLIVATEAAAIVAGSAILRAVGLGSATVAWVSVVVGGHFVALAALWRMSLFRPLGAAIASCGVVAIAAAAAGADHGWVAGIGGVLPGGLLLWAATRTATTAPRACPEALGSAAGRRG
jgi:hypothetical protein